MKDWKRWLLFLVCWAGSLAVLDSQVLAPPTSQEQNADGGADAPPADGILDRAGVFQRDPTRLKKLTERIRRLREDHGYLLYVVVESVLVKGNGQLAANDLRNRWIPDGNGLVFVFEVDSRRLSLGQKLEQDFGVEKEVRETLVPSYETNLIISEAAEDMKQDVAPEVFLDGFLTRVTGGLEDYFKRKSDPVPEGRTVRLGMVIIGAAATLALFALGAAWLLRRADRAGSGRCFFFPETEAVERLGAPYGGGEVSSRRFGTDGGAR